MGKKVFFGLAFCFVFLCGVQAAEPQPETEQEPVTVEAQDGEVPEPEAENSTAPQAEAAAETAGEDDTFIPTAQISEDLSVSFPIDI